MTLSITVKVSLVRWCIRSNNAFSSSKFNNLIAKLGLIFSKPISMTVLHLLGVYGNSTMNDYECAWIVPCFRFDGPTCGELAKRVTRRRQTSLARSMCSLMFFFLFLFLSLSDMVIAFLSVVLLAHCWARVAILVDCFLVVFLIAIMPFSKKKLYIALKHFQTTVQYTFIYSTTCSTEVILSIVLIWPNWNLLELDKLIARLVTCKWLNLITFGSSNEDCCTLTTRIYRCDHYQNTLYHYWLNS